MTKKKTIFAGIIALAVVVAAAAGFALYTACGEENHAFDFQAESPAHVAAIAAVPQLDASGNALLGVTIRLQDDWKTYWREPWESGLPPLLDWSGSSNLKSAQALWPAPERFDDPGGSYLGYQDELVLPIALQAENKDQPVRAELLLRYAVCREICIPLEERLTWVLSPAGDRVVQDASAQARLEAALEKVPTAQSEKAQLVDARLNGDALEVQLITQEPLDKAFLLVEEPAPYLFGRERLLESIAEGDSVVARYSLPLLQAETAEEMRAKGVRLLFRNGETALSSHLPVY